MKILFATDLDNTLLHSYRHRSKDDICVEYINCKPSTYMSKYVYEQLPILAKDITIIPITTRTIAQYNRIDFPNDCIKTAVTTNGAFLLQDGNQIDYSVILDFKHANELHKIKTELQKDPNEPLFKFADDKYLYAVYETKEITEKMSKVYNFTSIIPVVSGRKLYFIPPYYNKAIALQKLRKDFDLVIAAGDSDLDISMLNIADISIMPQNIANKVNCKNKIICPSNKQFSDFVIKTINSLIKKKLYES